MDYSEVLEQMFSGKTAENKKEINLDKMSKQQLIEYINKLKNKMRTLESSLNIQESITSAIKNGIITGLNTPVIDGSKTVGICLQDMTNMTTMSVVTDSIDDRIQKEKDRVVLAHKVEKELQKYKELKYKEQYQIEDKLLNIELYAQNEDVLNKILDGLNKCAEKQEIYNTAYNNAITDTYTMLNKKALKQKIKTLYR